MPRGVRKPLLPGETPPPNSGKRWTKSETMRVIEGRIVPQTHHEVIAEELGRTNQSCRLRWMQTLRKCLSGRITDEDILKLISQVPQAVKDEDKGTLELQGAQKRSQASNRRKYKVEKRRAATSTRESPVNSSKWSAKDHEAGALLMGLAHTDAMLRPPPSLSVSSSSTVQRPATSQSVSPLTTVQRPATSQSASPLTTVPRPAMSGSISPRTNAINPLTFDAGSTFGSFRMADQYPAANGASTTLAIRSANPVAQTQYVAPVVSQTPAATTAASTPQSFKSAGGVELLNRDDSPSAPTFTPVNGN